MLLIYCSTTTMICKKWLFSKQALHYIENITITIVYKNLTYKYSCFVLAGNLYLDNGLSSSSTVIRLNEITFILNKLILQQLQELLPKVPNVKRKDKDSFRRFRLMHLLPPYAGRIMRF